MKKSFACLLFLFSLVLPVVAEPDLAQEARTYVLGCHLKNFQTALSMWQVDHSGSYPETLGELSPNYLRVIPKGPYGSVQDWKYQRADDGRGFHFSLAGQSLKPSEPFNEKRPLQPARLSAPKSASLSLALPSSEENNWRVERNGYVHLSENQYIRSHLTGPSQVSMSGEQWLIQATNAFKHRAGQQITTERAVKIGGLSGIEFVTFSGDYSSHDFFLTDGILGWEVSYVGKTSDFSQEMQDTFVSMVRNAKRR